MTTTEALLNQFEHGTPREHYHAAQQLKRLGPEVEPQLVAIINRPIDDQSRIAALAILATGKTTCPATVDAVVRQLSHKNTRVRQQAASTLLHASPRLKRVLSQLQSCAARETDVGTRAILEKVLARYPRST